MVTRVSDALGGTVVVRPSWGTFEETVDQLIAVLVSSGRLGSSRAAVAGQRIREREAIAGTAMVDIGVSIPHARIAGVDRIVAAMAVSSGAVYEVAAGLPISIVVLVLSSPDLTGEHLDFLSGVSHLLQSDRMRELLRHAGSVDEVVDLVRGSEIARG
ncbi:PTS sugar transporter subunit IIA [Candidatus Binatia bacterium]|nr:PTS sugar transporter subunit IIA [Candidatus Binatia bacterium]